MTFASERLAKRLAATSTVAKWSGSNAAGTKGTYKVTFTPASTPPPPPPPPPGNNPPTVAPSNAVFTDTASNEFDLNGYGFNNNPWSGGHGPQEIWVVSDTNWGAISTQPAGNTAVLTYPFEQVAFYESSNLSGKTYPLLSSLKEVSVTFAQEMPAASNTYDAECAFDLWCGTVDVATNDYTNAWKYEIMIWVQNHGQTPGGSKVGTLTSGTQTYDVYQSSDQSYTACVITSTPITSGTVDVLGILNSLVAEGHLPSGLEFTACQFGWEICSTNGEALGFEVTNFAATIN